MKKENKSKQFGFRLNDSDLEMIKELSKESKLPMAAVIRNGIQLQYSTLQRFKTTKK